MVRFVQKFTDAIIFTNIFLATAVTSLVFETYIILFGTIIDYKYPFFLFCSTLFLYCFHRVYRFGYREPGEKLAKRHLWIEENKILFYSVMALAGFGVIYSLFFFVNAETILWLLPIGLLSLGYTVPIVPAGKKWIRLRDIFGIKIFLISIVLGITTVLLPILYGHDLRAISKPEILFVFFRRVLFIFAITIPFDIRDMEYDKEKHTHTFPVLFGEKKSKAIAAFSLCIFILLSVVQFITNINTSSYYLIALILSAVFSVIVIRLTDSKRDDFFYSFYVEGMMLLQCIFILVAHKFW